MILEFSVKGYRSLQDIEVKLDNLNIITGPNGCGKSNLYNAIHLLAKQGVGIDDRSAIPTDRGAFSKHTT